MEAAENEKVILEAAGLDRSLAQDALIALHRKLAWR
jgi:hypothetical protein